MSKFKNSKGLPRAQSRGFTLIEILLATFILVMVGVAAIGVERNFMGSAGVNKHKLQATALAQEGISAVRAAYNNHLLDSNNLPLTTGTYIVSDIDGSLGQGLDESITINNVTFIRTITVP